MSLEATSRWGLAPVAVALGVGLALRLGAVTSRGPLDRHALLRGSVFAFAAIVTSVRIAGELGGLDQGFLFGALFVTTATLFLFLRDRRIALPWPSLVTRETLPMLVVAGLATTATAVAAYLLPVWQWDALGYHLPYVNFALQRGSLSGVPADVPYLSTYPHVVEHYFIAWRAMLPDDRLVDAAQIPLGILGAAAIAVIARQLGARHDHALLAGISWLTLPAVFLQLPTNYIDIGTGALLLCSAAFVIGEPNADNVVGAGVSLGLFVGSKPNAPIAAGILFGVLVVRGLRAGRRASLATATACVLLLGAESYVRNLLHHGNPIWPVRLSLGPLELPGVLPMNALLESGCAAPRLHGPLPLRLLRSWTSLDAPPVFDMRFGGLGPLFLAALPVAVVLAWRRHRSPALAAVAVASLASPDPVVPRYILAFPGLVLAVASSGLDRLRPIPRRVLLVAAAFAATVTLARAYPGLVGEGPQLGAYARMTERQRLRAVGADGSPAAFYDALERLGPGDVTAFDSSLELPYLAWPPDLSAHATWLRDGISPTDTERIVHDPRVRLLIVDELSPVATAARAGERFTEIHRCKPRVPPKCFEGNPPSPARPPQDLPEAFRRTTTCVILYRP